MALSKLKNNFFIQCRYNFGVAKKGKRDIVFFDFFEELAERKRWHYEIEFSLNGPPAQSTRHLSP